MSIMAHLGPAVRRGLRPLSVRKRTPSLIKWERSARLVRCYTSGRSRLANQPLAGPVRSWRCGGLAPLPPDQVALDSVRALTRPASVGRGKGRLP
jgi:hypothetical protein